MHVNNTTRSCFYKLTQLRSIRRSFSTDFAKTSAHIKSFRSLQQCFSRCHSRCREKTAICPQRRSQVDLEQEKVRPYHSCAEGSSPLAHHPSAYRLCSLSTTPCMVEVRHTSAAPAILFERSAPGLTCDRLFKVTWRCLEPGLVAFWAQKLPCLGTGCLELIVRGHSNSGTVTGAFQIYVVSTFFFREAYA